MHLTQAVGDGMRFMKILHGMGIGDGEHLHAGGLAGPNARDRIFDD
jgi:hypothetical protein